MVSLCRQADWRVILNGLVSSRSSEDRFTDFTSTSEVENVIKAQWLAHALCGSKAQSSVQPLPKQSVCSFLLLCSQRRE